MPHRCYDCNPTNPMRIRDGAAMRFPARFRGPPGNVNGGMAVGSLACPALVSLDDDCAVATRVTARLRRGIPVECALTARVTQAEGALEVAVGDAEGDVMTGVVTVALLHAAPNASDALPIDAAPERASVLAEMARVPVPDKPPFYIETGDHPIAGCFSCGPEHTDGLHIYPRVAADGLTCATWTPAQEFDAGNGAVATSVLTSALDCSSGICMPVDAQRELLAQDGFFLLGSMDARYLRLPTVGRDYRVVARALERDGRKFYGLSALFDDEGTLYATVDTIWIIAGITRTEAFGDKTTPRPPSPA